MHEIFPLRWMGYGFFLRILKKKKTIQLLGRTGLQAKGVPGVLAEDLMIQLVKNQLVYPLAI